MHKLNMFLKIQKIPTSSYDPPLVIQVTDATMGNYLFYQT